MRSFSCSCFRVQRSKVTISIKIHLQAYITTLDQISTALWTLDCIYVKKKKRKARLLLNNGDQLIGCTKAHLLLRLNVNKHIRSPFQNLFRSWKCSFWRNIIFRSVLKIFNKRLQTVVMATEPTPSEIPSESATEEPQVQEFINSCSIGFADVNHRRYGPDRVLLTGEYSKWATYIRNMEVRPDDTWVITFPKCGKSI